ncbi:ribosome maturation factor RimM [Desulfocurvibacter africanus]|uniref:ribosome maturation factor RimM n=1 Tax=Desulfocurvibacter africanus TaxID=873 RepID=UPI0004108D11|nr:ribosome maturation factor RimM [Desulfocurvibacter africanus]
MPDTEWVLIGEVAKSHGLKGEFSVKYYADSPLLLDEVGHVWLSTAGGRPKRFQIRAWRGHQDRVLLWLTGIDGRDQADAWRGAEVLLKESELPAPEEGGVYLHDLQGLTVLLEDGSRLGTITDFILEPQELWSITTDKGEEVLFPAVPELVPNIDLEAGTVTIAPPPGLLDLYLKKEEADG